jgi:hypothetical protein
MDDGRAVEFDPASHPHLDHGHAVTSHSSQGQTADRVLIHVDTQLGAKDLLNNRMAYVAVSRGAYDAQIFTDDRDRLGAALDRDVSHQSAHVPELKLGEQIAAQIEPDHKHGSIGMALGWDIDDLEFRRKTVSPTPYLGRWVGRSNPFDVKFIYYSLTARSRFIRVDFRTLESSC